MGTPISYTFSPQLHSLTSSIDQYHTQILTTPLAPRNEIALRTRATHHRILSILSHAHIPMTEPELITLLMHPPKRPHPIEKEVLLYRQALSYIRDEWTGRIDYFFSPRYRNAYAPFASSFLFTHFSYHARCYPTHVKTYCLLFGIK